jgi:hypothetical protein
MLSVVGRDTDPDFPTSIGREAIDPHVRRQRVD